MSIVTTPEERFEDVPDYDYPHERVPVTEDGAEMAYVDVGGGSSYRATRRSSSCTANRRGAFSTGS